MPTALTDRVRQHPPVPQSPLARGLWTTPRVLLGALAVSYLTCLGALVAWSVLPLAVGWSTYVVQSDSMAPAVRTGDALVTAPVDPSVLRPGNVVVVDDPAVAGRVLSHRVDAIRPDGLIVTRGDANAQSDSTPVRPDALRGLARLRIPLVGLPGHWVAQGSYAPPLALLAATVTAVAAAATDPSRRARSTPAQALWRRLRAREPRRAGSPAALALLTGTALTATTLGLHTSSADAAFAVTTGNGGNSFAAAADWVAPDASAVTIAKASPAGYLGGAVRPNNQYYVHAAVTDTGNPASGVSTVTADVSTVTAGQTAAALAAGSTSVQGVAYTRSNASPLTAGATTGSRSYAVTMTDAAANARTRTGYTVSVDGTPPTASDAQATNTSGGIVGRPEAGDTLSLTYSEVVDPFSILAGWTGSAQSVTVRFAKSGPNTSITVLNGGSTLPLGSVAVGATWSNSTFDVVSSTMTQTGNRIDIVLGTSSATSTNGATTLTWTPDAAAFDAAGNNATTAAATESGAADADF